MEKARQLKAILQLLRPHHYTKNLFVVVPLFFAGQFTELDLLYSASIAFVSFCLISSSVYVFNDLIDIEEDRIHPQNCKRPLASGALSKTTAVILDILFSAAALSISFFYHHSLFYIILSYKIINILYSLFLKKLAVLDVMILSLGFVLRLYAGSVVTDVILTEWIIILTFLLSMLLGFGKRRLDAAIFENEGVVLRISAKGYNLPFLNYSMLILAAVIIVAYLMYTLSPETTTRMGSDYLYTTVFWVIAGILRYLQLVFVQESTDNPVSILIKDLPIKLILGAWIVHFLLFIYIS